MKHFPRTTITLLMLSLAVLTCCAICPLSNTLVLRPFLSNFDSRYCSPGIAPESFDRDLWRKGNARHRVGMAHYLVEQKLLEGKSRGEVVEMLGEPDVDKPGDEGVRWLLGYYAKGLFDETMWLEITIKDDGTATGAIVSVNWDDPRNR